MSVIEHPAAVPETVEAVVPARPARPGRRLWFWIARYLPAEIVGTAAMIIAGLGATFWTDSPAIIAAAGVIGEIIGFYIVLAISVHLEQSRLGHPFGRALSRTGVLLVAEFGVSELLDTLLIRPATLIAAVWLLGDPLWGLLVGKVVADIVFYAIAAGAFTITDKSGLRARGPKESAA